MKIESFFLSALLIVTPTLHAQIVADGATNTLSNQTNTITGDVTVGTNGSFTVLALSDNALLTNSAHGVIGRNATAQSNEVRVVNATARWLIGSNFFVGSNGAFNRLVVSNGAFLNNNNGLLGNGVSSSNNFALVTGSGSLWSNRSSLTVGFSGRDNQLIVSNGARVVSLFGALGSRPGSSNNLVVVTGSGSFWTNHSVLVVGDRERGNRLVIEAGGQVDGDESQVGSVFGADNSEVLVTGPGSLWSSRADVVVGLNPSNNRIVVSNGAAVVVGNNVRLGVQGTNNTVLVTGAGSLWNNQFELYLGEGGSGTGNRMEVHGGGRVVSSNTYVGSFGASNVAMVTGAGSLWSNRAGMFVGHSSSANQLVVSNGGQAANDSATIGAGSGASNNFVLLTGAGALWNNLNDINVGDSGRGNQLIVSNGAVLSDNRGFIGAAASAANNEVIVTGAGSVWTNRNIFSVGSASANNRLVINDGGLVVDLSAKVGANIGASSNEVIVTGSGSVWSNQVECVIGYAGGGNRLTISNGGLVMNGQFGVIGDLNSSSANEVVVTGSGSVWSNSAVAVGYQGSLNRLVISDGGVVSALAGYIGSAILATNNQVLVTGPGSVFSNELELYVGYDGNHSRLVVSNSGIASASAIYLGNYDPSPPFIPPSHRISVDGGTVRATNELSTGILLLNFGTNALNSGLIEVDQLIITNTPFQTAFEFNGGTLATRYMISKSPLTSSPQNFVVGAEGNIPAIWDMRPGISIPTVINDATGLLPAAATPYPSQLLVTGASGALTNLTVTLSGLDHTFPDDVDILLVGPGGQKVMLMSDAGGNSTLTNVTLVFDDAASGLLPDSTAITSGFYKPTDYELDSNLPAPAPGGPYANSLSAFTGSDPNGHWSLYVVDDRPLGSGLLRGWGLQIQTATGAVLDVLIDPFVSTVQSNIVIGQNVPGCQLLMNNSRAILRCAGGIVGFNSASINNRVVIGAGKLFVTNAAGLAPYDLRRGTNVLNAGLMQVNRLLVTNNAGQFEFNGGTLISGGTTNINGRVFTVGNGTSLSTLSLRGGTHHFANGLVIPNRGWLIGTGSITGPVAVQSGGTLSPGISIGTLSLNDSPTLQGTIVMELSKNGSIRTNDLLQVTGTFIFGGSLAVTNLGPTALVAGDNFKLFNAPLYSDSFSPLSLPPLNAGLGWTNKLLVDGSIEVVELPSLPKFSNLTVSGANLIISGTNGTSGANYAVLTATNVATPASNWVSLVTNQFTGGGGFSFTNPIAPGEPQRYFRLRTP